MRQARRFRPGQGGDESRRMRRGEEVVCRHCGGHNSSDVPRRERGGGGDDRRRDGGCDSGKVLRRGRGGGGEVTRRRRCALARQWSEEQRRVTSRAAGGVRNDRVSATVRFWPGETSNLIYWRQLALVDWATWVVLGHVMWGWPPWASWATCRVWSCLARWAGGEVQARPGACWPSHHAVL
jgi:hypothetical protein